MIRWLLAWSVLFGAAAASADDDARRWLDEMNRAFAEQSYDGIVSHYSGRELATLRIVHKRIDGEQRERLVHLNGARREILRRGDEIICMVEPDDALLALVDAIGTGPFASALVRDYSRVSDHYSLTVGGEDRVADRPALRLVLAPRDSDRYGYRLWIDEDTRLLLRSELVDADDNRLEIFQFNQLVLGDQVNPAALEPDAAEGSPMHRLMLAPRERPARPVDAVDWQARWLPAGFSLAIADVRNGLKAAAGAEPVTRMMYTDGLAAFSLFIEPSRPDADGLPGIDGAMESQDGATVAVSRLIAPLQASPAGGSRDGVYALAPAAPAGFAVGGHLVTVVGEIPLATARRIAESVYPRSTR